MRKVIILMAVCISTLMLVGCGAGKEQSVTLTTEQNGTTVEMLLEAKGDIVQSMTQTSALPYDIYGEDQVEAVKEAVETECLKVQEKLTDIEGAEYTYEMGENEVTEVFKIDMTNTDTLDKLSELELLPLEGESGSKISLKKTQESLTEDGTWTVVE